MGEDEVNALNCLFRDVCNSLDISPEDVKEAVDLIRNEIITRPWNSSDNYAGVDFNDAARRCAYLKRFGGCHCALTRKCTLELLVRMPLLELQRLFVRGTLKVVSVGGGPGNDLIGFCSAVSELNRCGSMRLTVIDKKSGWEDVFESMVSTALKGSYGSVSGMFKNLHLTRNFVESDVAEETPHASIVEADVILMTKVLSWVSPAQKLEILQKIFSNMKDNAIFLFIDICSEFVARVAESSGLKLLLRSNSSSIFPFKNYMDNSSITRSTYEICAVQKLRSLASVPNGFYRL